MNVTVSPERSDTRSYHGLLLLALLGLQAAIFYVHVTRDVAPFYPPIYDQLNFYLATYDLIAALRGDGAHALLNELFQPANPTGTTFAVQGALLALIGGANRMAILRVNLVYLFALQIVLFCTIRAISNAAFAWTGIALLLAASTIFQTAGGIYDFRIDFSVMCLYGIWCCLIVTCGVFRESGKIVWIALIAVLLIYSRFFTIIFVAGVLGGLLALNLYQLWRAATVEAKALARRRAWSIVLCGLIVAATCLPRLYLSRDAIYGYYVVGHILNDEKFIRAAEVGIQDALDHLLYYPKSVLRRHVGASVWILAGLLAGWSFWSDRISIRKAAQRLARFGHEFTALGLATIVPIAILTTNISKSPVVGSIATVPLILMIVLTGIAIWPHGAVVRLTSRVAINLAVLATIVGIVTFATRGLSSADVPPRADLDRIAAVNNVIARYAADNKLDRISMSVDRVVDYLSANSVRLFSIEERHRTLRVDGLLGHGAHGIFATSRADALRLLADSDVIALTDPTIDRSIPYPSNTAVRAYWQDLLQWTAAHRNLLLTTDIFGVPYRIYVRPPTGRAPSDG